jgi:hypothetical protein
MFGMAAHDEQGVVKSVSLRPEEVPMVARVNRQIVLKSRPEGAPSLDNFTLKQGWCRSPATAKCSCARAGSPSIPICAAA